MIKGVSVKEDLRGADDRAILARAQAEGRIVITQDKGFGELACRFGLPAACGVILLRCSQTSPGATTRRMLQVISSRNDWSGCFAVATDDRLRLRFLKH